MEKNNIKRCKNCILPANYPGIQFNDKGICNFCLNHKQPEYVGIKSFVKELKAFNETKKDRNREYDCLLGFSGGRDSTYLLYLLTKQLDLKVLAYSADHGYVPEQTKLNMQRATDRTKSTLVIEEHDFLKKNLRPAILAWIHRPSLPMIEMFCAGCKLGVEGGTLDYAEKHKIPAVVRGSTNLEYNDYRFSFFKINPNSKKGFSMFFGLLSCIIKNPRWLLNPAYVKIQTKESLLFITNIFRDTKSMFKTHKNYDKRGLKYFAPFQENIRWEEKTVMSVIKNELDWGLNPHSKSTWRGDCTIALLKLYTYNEILGFNDKVVNLSNLIRDHQLSREEALKRLEEEQKIPDALVKEVLDRININFTDFKNAVQKAKINYSKGIIR
jgi:hypothetical protein